MKFIAWALLCFIAATDSVGRFCHSRFDELLLLLQRNAHSAMPHESTTFFAQKGLHVFLYAMLGYFAASERDTRRRKLENAAGAAICILTEIFQYFTKTRHMSPYDMALNLAAFTLAAAWCMHLQRPETRTSRQDTAEVRPNVAAMQSDGIIERSGDAAGL